MPVTDEKALPYREPEILTVLIWSGFIILLNVAGHICDRICSASLVGQIMVGVAFGTSGGRLLGVNAEEIVVILGYLGLLLLVFEGGLSTSFDLLKANFSLSCFVAITGILLPIALSFLLIPLANAIPRQAFAAGAALCSTSLGTTFAVLKSSGLITTRLGVILSSAAMMDDVVGLVMVQVISNLGSGEVKAATIVRPIFVAGAFGIAVPLTCRFISIPVTNWINSYTARSPSTYMSRFVKSRRAAVVIQTTVLLSLVTGASYAGTSNLFAAYLAGAAISWWYSNLGHAHTREDHTTGEREGNSGQRCLARVNIGTPEPNYTENIRPNTIADSQGTPDISAQFGELTAFNKYYATPLQRVLQPFFFASIGFSIPLSEMFVGKVFWRGLVYAILMSIGKAVCGLWLVRAHTSVARCSLRKTRSTNLLKMNTLSIPTNLIRSHQQQKTKPVTAERDTSNKPDPRHLSPSISLYPCAILGCAMIARGEIGFLISSLAQTDGVLGESFLFLVVTWAILLCTITGPILVGVTVSHLRKVSINQDFSRQSWDVLGAWGEA